MSYSDLEKKLYLGAKPLLASKTFWASLLAFVPLAADALNQVAQLPVLPPPVAAGIAAVGGTLAIISRYLAKQEIKGLIKSN